MTKSHDVLTLTNQQLLTEVKLAAHRERASTAWLIRLLAQVDARRLYLGEGCSSLFTYCTQVLRLSEHAAYGRIEAARASRRYPIVLDLLADGSVTLTAITLLTPHLTPDNHLQVLSAARHRSKREVEQLVAHLRPRPDVPSSVRKLPSPSSTASTATTTVVGRSRIDDSPALLAPSRPPRAAVVMPLAPERYNVQLTISRQTHDKLRRVQDLLRHSVPSGDLAVIFDRALTVLLNDLERAKSAAAERPQPTRKAPSSSRHIPATVRREVWKRDGARCAFVGAEGRCTERGFLEFHHVEPHAVGGKPDVQNIELRCRAHNLYEAERYFGSRLPLLAKEVGCAYVC